MLNKIVVPTGYMGSGSSAITDLLQEVDNYIAPNDNFEYVFLHCPDGLFDLEDKLLISNNSFRSDEALHSFVSCMEDLYRKKHYWVADYESKISPDFICWVNDFVNSIIDYRTTDFYWYYQENPNLLIYIYQAFCKIVRVMTNNNVILKKKLRYQEMLLSFTDSDRFYSSARTFIKKFFVELGLDNNNLILDQFLLPHNLFRFKNYFDENVRFIVVERDPRDVFLLNKYYWKKVGVPLPYPLEVEQFCDFYKKMRVLEKKVKSESILRIRFEDLIYIYEETVDVIFNFLDIDGNCHSRKMKYLNPNKSITNTQIFNNPLYLKEANFIEKKLPEYLYNFPYSLSRNLEKTDLIL